MKYKKVISGIVLLAIFVMQAMMTLGAYVSLKYQIDDVHEIANPIIRPGGFAIRRSLSIRIYNPPYNYPLCRSWIKNPNTQNNRITNPIGRKEVYLDEDGSYQSHTKTKY